MEIDELAIEQFREAIDRNMLAKKMKKCNDKFKTTFDWSTCLKPEMPWRFGVYDVMDEFQLDYSLHLRDNTAKQGIFRFEEEEAIVRLAFNGPSYEEEPRKIYEIMQDAMNATGCEHLAMYSQHVLIKLWDTGYKIPNIVSFELGPFVWITFNRHSLWPAIYRRSDLDDSNYLTYNQKGSNVFVLHSDYGMVRAYY